MYKLLNCNIICNGKQIETTQISISREMIELSMRNPHSEAQSVIKRNEEYLYILRWSEIQDVLVKQRKYHL